MTLSQSIKAGQKEFNERYAAILGHPLHARQSVERFLATFARKIAEEALEAIKIQEATIFPIRSDPTKTEEDYEAEVHEQNLRVGWNQAVQTQSQLINNYLKGEEDE